MHKPSSVINLIPNRACIQDQNSTLPALCSKSIGREVDLVLPCFLHITDLLYFSWGQLLSSECLTAKVSVSVLNSCTAVLIQIQRQAVNPRTPEHSEVHVISTLDLNDLKLITWNFNPMMLFSVHHTQNNRVLAVNWLIFDMKSSTNPRTFLQICCLVGKSYSTTLFNTCICFSHIGSLNGPSSFILFYITRGL